ncbi:hypothetical protein I4U23_015599 [Adineta vaga]|nr:hypothetical protein I4U23_015599 [Adineta vaga]
MNDNETNPSSLTEVIQCLDQLQLPDLLLRGIYEYGFKQLSDLQQRALKPCIMGYDVIVQAPSGTGKTITFIIAILQQLDMNCQDCQALILVPTRELAQEIHRIILILSKHMNVTCHACFGGVNIGEDMKRLEAGVQIVISTPGRIFDMLKRSVFHLEHIKMFVLNEADEIFSRGYKDQIDDLVAMLPGNPHFIVVSSTMPSDLLETTDKIMNNPVKILIMIDDRTLEGIRQFYVNIEREECKLNKLYELFDTLAIAQTIIYCNTCEKVKWLSEKLRAHDLTVSVLDFSMNAEQRENAIKEFRMGSSRILLRTDRSEDDNDIPQVSPIFNYDLPTHCENYVRRIGRRGRFGRNGLAINFINNHDREQLHRIEQFYNTKIEQFTADTLVLI